LIEVKIEIG